MGAVFSYSIQPPINQSQQTKPEQRPEERAAPVAANNVDPNERIADYTGALVLLTIVMAVGTVGLWYIAARTARRQLRAYLVTVDSEVKNLEVGRVVRAVVSIKNAGQTPAHDAHTWIGAGLNLWRPPYVLPDPPTTRKSISVIGPGITRHTSVDMAGPLTEQHLRGLIDGSAVIHVCGGMTYRDVFGRNRKTTFNLFYGGPYGANERGALSNGPNGNEAD